MIIKINENNKGIILKFIQNLGKSRNHFRYYNHRGIDVIKNHLATFVELQDDVPVAYGHLDLEDGKVWVGIAVVERCLGKGFGKKMMSELINNSINLGIKTLFLSVDSDNYIAQKMYIKNGFKVSCISDDKICMVREN